MCGAQNCVGRSVTYLQGGEVVASVVLRDGESFDSLLKRFRGNVIKERVLSDLRKKRYFISRSEQRRIDRRRGIRRARRRAAKAAQRY